MTDTRTFLNQLTSQVNTFLISLEQIKLLADRIDSDSAISTALAAAAQTAGRTDLAIADFDNFNNAVKLLEAKLNGTDASVNTGGSVKLAFYKIV